MPDETLLQIAESLADAARPIALRYFRSNALGVEGKGVGPFDPVTRADREIELRMRDILTRERPDDGVLGEEHGAKLTSSGLTWILDPIDGTRAFMCGLPNWGVLIACNDGTKPFIGIIDQPFTGERFIGYSDGQQSEAILKNTSGSTILTTRDTARLEQAVVCATAPEIFSTQQEKKAFERLHKSTRLVRMGTDCYGYAMLALGQVDMVFEAGLQPYDIQALIPIVEGAGGIITDWRGGDAQNGGQVIACADPRLHEQALALIAPYI